MLRRVRGLLEREANRMKTISLVLSLAVAGGLVACSQVNPISRDQLAENLAPILRMERRVDQVKYYTQMLAYLGGISSEKTEDLKAHHDIYYVYYVAANVQLARGDMESYLAHVSQAERELDLMEAILKDKLSKFGELDSEREEPFSRSGL